MGSVFVIGASLSEPHTSVTASRTRVSIYGPTTYRKFKISAFKYFTMIECSRLTDVQLSRQNEREGLLSLLPDCWFGVKESESEDYSS